MYQVLIVSYIYLPIPFSPFIYNYLLPSSILLFSLEFTTTLTGTQDIINMLVSYGNSIKVPFLLIADFQRLLDDYEMLLSKLNHSGILMKYLTNNRLKVIPYLSIYLSIYSYHHIISSLFLIIILVYIISYLSLSIQKTIDQHNLALYKKMLEVKHILLAMIQAENKRVRTSCDSLSLFIHRQ